MHSPLRRVFVLFSLLCLVAGCTSCGGGGGTPAPIDNPVVYPAFDSIRAFGDIKAQCDYGFRTPGSQAHTDCRAFLQTELAKYTDSGTVVSQDFSSKTPLGGATTYSFTNIIGLFGAAQPGNALLLLSHWDARPIADEDPNAGLRTQPVMAANDGASGVAVLLELARAFKAQVPPHPVILMFVDAEDSGTAGSTFNDYEGFCIGTDYYAKHRPVGLPSPTQAILLDMVGSLNNFHLYKEGFSRDSNPTLLSTVWAAAAAGKHDAFKSTNGTYVIDDHKPLIDAGIPSIDIIHWDQPPPEWHTTQDIPANCSADSLNQVGDTLLRVIYGG
jgi:glutaminyl-peptide cyclotransferase